MFRISRLTDYGIVVMARLAELQLPGGADGALGRADYQEVGQGHDWNSRNASLGAPILRSNEKNIGEQKQLA